MRIVRLLVLCLLGFSQTVRSDVDWMAATLDNDFFVGSDNGYTNGLYLSLFDVREISSVESIKPDFWVRPLLWSITFDDVNTAVNSYTIGQTMNTPRDITVAIPDDQELPYSALLAMTNNYVTIGTAYADRIGTTVGIIGPSALGAEVQKLVHELIGSDEPLGWETQLKDELVFQFSRARAWRSWVSNSGHIDAISTAEFGIGTLRSAVNFGMTLRSGRGLARSYATTLFDSSRTANPGAVNGGWYLYGGLNGGFIFNQIFTDGNTYRDSRSVDYRSEYIGITAGLAYSWENVSFSFSINNANIIQGAEDDETLDNITQFGTFTLAWKM